jgi:hypothetical protein
MRLPEDPMDMTCDELTRLLPAYLQGALPEREARALEQHAATCDVCEPRLEAATRLELSFAPPLPASLRDNTLRAVQSSAASTPHRPTSRRAAQASASRWRFMAGLTTLAAAAVLLIVVTRRAPVSVRSGDSAATVVLDEQGLVANSMQAAAGRIADAGARAEFAQLDAAAREVEAALAAAPDDADLRAYARAVRARRDELARRVKEASS